MYADQRSDQPRDDEHVDRIEACERFSAEFGARAKEVRQIGPDDRSRAGDVHRYDRRPERAVVERKQIAGERHRHRQDQQNDADHPVQLARVLVGAEEERAPHVQEDQARP